MAAVKFDFSEFHPLDHRWGSLRCWRLPRGPIRHAVLWWTYMRPGLNFDDWEEVTPDWMIEEREHDEGERKRDARIEEKRNAREG